MKAHMQNTELNFYPRKALLIVIFAVGCLLHTQALPTTLNSDSLLIAADAQFNQKSYQEAAESYHQLFANGWSSPSALLRYAWIKETSGQPGEAVYALYKYYLITEDQTAYNKVLELTDKYRISGYEQSESEYLFQKLYAYRNLVTIILLVVSAGLMGLSVYYRHKGLTRSLTALQYTNLGVLTLLFFVVNFTSGPDKAVINQEGTYLMKGPSAAAGIASTIAKGDLVTVKDDQDIWVRVTVDQKEGWVKATALSR